LNTERIEESRGREVALSVVSSQLRELGVFNV
jgi:hypothetical protein